MQKSTTYILSAGEHIAMTPELPGALTALEDAGWFGKDNLPILPIKASIAHQMIESFINT